jgi:carboxymethylenebutenolidase
MAPQNEEGTTLTPTQQAMSDLWDKHMQSEFESRSVEDTLETMVDDPYVNHVPVLTGGVGLEEVRKFYSERASSRSSPQTPRSSPSRAPSALTG